MSGQLYVTITEEPAAKQQRFRYASEVDGARSVGSIPGVNSTSDRKTFPSIHVHGYTGPFVVLLSLLNPDNNLIHPHSITGSDPRYKCKDGVIFVIAEDPDVVFKNIGVLCVKGKTEKDVKSALKMRQHMGVDPFNAGFPHMYDHSRINFTAVRLCFQVFLPAQDWTPADRNHLRKYTRPLPAVVSQVIYDAKKLNELKIVHINSCAGSTSGGNEMTILCDKYTGLNPDVVFDDERGWTQAASVKIYHKQLAIVFEAPPYPVHRDGDNLKVKVYLQQTSDRGVERSPPATVEYLPNDPKGSPKFPSPPQSEKSGISLKQVRIQQRPCRAGPESGRLKRWRPWGRGEAPPDPSATDSEEDHISSDPISSDHISQIIIRELKHTAPGQTAMAASYPANILTKGKCSAKRRPNNSSSQAHTCGVNYDFKMSPSSYQEFSPPVNTPELGYNRLNFLPSTSWKVNSINENIMVPEINTNDNINPHVVNDNNINSLPSTSGIHHVDPGLKYRFCTKMPAGTKVKRGKGPDSEELPYKRDKLMSIDFEDILRDVPLTNVHPNPFLETNRPPPIQNVVLPPAAGLPIGGEYVDEYDPLLTDEVVKLILDVLGPEGVPGLTNMVAEGDQWHRQRVNIPRVNQPIQHDHANLQHNVAQPGIFNNVDQSLPDYHINIDLPHNVGHTMFMRGNQASDHIESVSEELSKMNVQDK